MAVRPLRKCLFLRPPLTIHLIVENEIVKGPKKWPQKNIIALILFVLFSKFSPRLFFCVLTGITVSTSTLHTTFTVGLFRVPEVAKLAINRNLKCPTGLHLGSITSITIKRTNQIPVHV